MDSVKTEGFTGTLDDLISRWYEWRFGEKRTDKFLDDAQLQIFMGDVYDYSYYCFSTSDQEAMDKMNKKNHKLRQPTLTLMQGGKNDDDEPIN
jgi:hypothetical protein